MIELVGIIFLSIEILVLKNILYNTGSSYCKKYTKFKLKVWHLILLIILNLFWAVGVILFIISTGMFIAMLSEKDVKIDYNKDSKIFKFLNKEL